MLAGILQNGLVTKRLFRETAAPFLSALSHTNSDDVANTTRSRDSVRIDDAFRLSSIEHARFSDSGSKRTSSRESIDAAVVGSGADHGRSL